MFTNEFWKVVSSLVTITVVDGSEQAIPLVTVTPTYLYIQNKNSPPTPAFTATAYFNAVCQQWYKFDPGSGLRIPVLDGMGTDMEYRFRTPVSCTLLNPWYLVIEVFDAGYFPYASSLVQAEGDCD